MRSNWAEITAYNQLPHIMAINQKLSNTGPYYTVVAAVKENTSKTICSIICPGWRWLSGASLLSFMRADDTSPGNTERFSILHIENANFHAILLFGVNLLFDRRYHKNSHVAFRDIN